MTFEFDPAATHPFTGDRAKARLASCQRVELDGQDSITGGLRPSEVFVDETAYRVPGFVDRCRRAEALLEPFVDRLGEAGEGLEQQLIHAVEVVRHRAQRYTGPAGDPPMRNARDSDLGDQVQRDIDQSI